MRESAIERYLVKQVTKHGGLCIKITSPGLIGMPDRLVVPTDGNMFFVELKAKRGRLSPAQLRRHAELKARNQFVDVYYSVEDIDKLFP